MIDDITGHCKVACDHLPCLVGIQNKNCWQNFGEMTLKKCSQTYARLRGSLKEEGKCGIVWPRIGLSFLYKNRSLSREGACFKFFLCLLERGFSRRGLMWLESMQIFPYWWKFSCQKFNSFFYF